MNRQIIKCVSYLAISAALISCTAKDMPAPPPAAEIEVVEEVTETAEIETPSPKCLIELVVLGHGQDAGRPQIGRHDDTAFTDPSQAVPATSLGVINHHSGARYLFDATPDISAQSYHLAQMAETSAFRLDGIFLTHGHMGHYLGLAFLGREAMGAKDIPVYAMPKMGRFLRENAPWDLLVKLKNIVIKPIRDEQAIGLPHGLTVTPFLVPHRGEYTETVGYRIQSPTQRAVYLPDIDSWHEWDSTDTDKPSGINKEIQEADILFLDATFYSGAELPGRDMSKIPHPTIKTSMERFKDMSAADKDKIYFIHLNHSNPALNSDSEEAKFIKSSGYNLAKTGEQYCLYAPEAD